VSASEKKTFTIPEKPVFTLPEEVYDDAQKKAARWHDLRREIAESAEKEKKKQEKLKKLAEREVEEGVSLEEEMDGLQREIDEIRKARERAQVRLAPALRAAWTAGKEARARIFVLTQEYDKARDAYMRVLDEIAEFVRKASYGLPTGLALRMDHYDRRHVEKKFDLPEYSLEFERGEAEREPTKKPSGAVEYVPAPVVTNVRDAEDAEARRPIQPVTREDSERMREEVVAEDGSDGESDEPADLLASVRSVLDADEADADEDAPKTDDTADDEEEVPDDAE
jgi:hypothetical protein